MRGTSAFNTKVSNAGALYSGDVKNDSGIRPVISLKPGTKYTTGDGSMENPYVVDIST